MDQRELDHAASIHNFEADAVCEQCSTVNPPGTLLCKSCGNNLREQREHRLSTPGAVEVPADVVRPRGILTGLLIVFGILIVIWAGVNSVNGNLEKWLMYGFSSVEAAGKVSAEVYWTGSDAPLYDDLLAELKANPVLESDVAGLPIEGSLRGDLDGRFALKLSANEFSPAIGSGIVYTEGENAFFVATLDGGAELRGMATRSGVGNFQAEHIGVNIQGTYYDAYGLASIGEDDVMTVSGLMGDVAYSAAAYRLP